MATVRTGVGVLDRCVAILHAVEAGHRSFAAIAVWFEEEKNEREPKTRLEE